MAINKVSGFKAGEIESGATLSKAEAEKLQKSVKEALQKIADIKKNLIPQDDKFIGVDEKNELAYREALLLADYNILDHFIKTGEMLDVAGVEAATAATEYVDLSKVDSGFYTYNKGSVSAATVAEESADSSIPDYAGTVYVSADSNPAKDPNTNKDIPTNLNYVMSDDPEKAVVKGSIEMRGNDAILKLEFKDGSKQSFVIKNLGARTDIQLTIIGTKQTTGFMFDASNFVSIDPATGAKRGIIVLGSQGNDTLIGTVANDLLFGGGGKDIIFGGKGADQAYGYVNQDVLNTYGEANLGADGDDIIYDIDADDYIDGGPDQKGDSVFIGSGNSIVNPTSGIENQGFIGEISDPSYAMDWLSTSSGWDVSIDDKTGELVMTMKSGATNAKVSLDLLAEEGFSIVGEMDGADAVFTAYKMENGEPVYYKIRVKNFASANTSLEIKNGIIDIGALDVGAKEVLLQGTDASGGNIIIDGQSVFDAYALSMADLKSNKSSFTDAQLEEMLEPYKTELSASGDPIWYNAKVKDGVIEVDEQFVKGDKFDIPTSFGSAVFVRREGGATYVTVASNVGNTSSRVVFKINTAQTQDYTFTQNGVPIDIYEVGTNPGTTIDGGAGKDFIVAHKYGAGVNDASGDSGLIISKNAIDHVRGEANATSTGDIAAKIEDATTYAELKTIYDEVSAMADGDEKNTLLDAIDMQAVSLFDSLASDINAQCEILTSGEASDTEISAAKSKITEDTNEMEKLIKIMRDNKDIKEAELKSEVEPEIEEAKKAIS